MEKKDVIERSKKNFKMNDEFKNYVERQSFANAWMSLIILVTIEYIFNQKFELGTALVLGYELVCITRAYYYRSKIYLGFALIIIVAFFVALYRMYGIG